MVTTKKRTYISALLRRHTMLYVDVRGNVYTRRRLGSVTVGDLEELACRGMLVRRENGYSRRKRLRLRPVAKYIPLAGRSNHVILPDNGGSLRFPAMESDKGVYGE